MDLTITRRSLAMAEDFKKTVRIVRQSNVAADDRGRNVWSEPVETVELELVSTQQLQTLLDTDDQAKQKIADAAEQQQSDTGVLAHDAANDSYEFVDAEGGDDFSLVSTQMLFKILEKDNLLSKPADEELTVDDVPDDAGGFDPYNNT